MTISVDNEHKKTDLFSKNNSATLFYQSADPNDIRNQNQFAENKFNKMGTEIRFGEPLTDSLKLSATTEILYYSSNESKQTYDFNDVSGEYDAFNAFQSNTINSSVLKISSQSVITFP